jgi:general secretion pathway protein G
MYGAEKQVPGQGGMHCQVASTSSRRSSRGAFTLLELLVVMSIIVILMGMIVGVARYAQAKAVRSKARTEIQEIHNALESFRIDKGNYPSEGDFNSLRDRLPERIRNQMSKRGDINRMLDPWKNPYVYTFNPDQPETYSVHSQGPLTNIVEDDIYSGK